MLSTALKCMSLWVCENQTLRLVPVISKSEHYLFIWSLHMQLCMIRGSAHLLPKFCVRHAVQKH